MTSLRHIHPNRPPMAVRRCLATELHLGHLRSLAQPLQGQLVLAQVDASTVRGRGRPPEEAFGETAERLRKKRNHWEKYMVTCHEEIMRN